MGESKGPNSRWAVDEAQEQTTTTATPRQTTIRSKNKIVAWIVVCTVFVLIAQSSATLLERLYYNDSGNTLLLAALLETIGFPILIPFPLFCSSGKPATNNNSLTRNEQPSNLFVVAVYIFLGLFQAASSVLCSIGLQRLPVSTFSLVSTTQLGFNAFFSFLFNAEKFTPPILNALVLLTISSSLLVFQTDYSENQPGNSTRKDFVVGFVCTLAASALHSLTMSMMQLTFNKVLKRETSFSAVLHMIICLDFVATCAVALPLFISGEWQVLWNEMESFELGKASYVIVVVMIAVAWQVYSIGAVGLTFEVSSLFSNVISTVGLPIVPVLAAIFFHEKLDGIKVISIVLAVWGFTSYVYQHYLNDCKTRNLVEEPSIVKNFINIQESQLD